ncbi:MAG: hypothetical protein C0467_19780 [Planctomycetaceae bacterium]|nr:hypothetical protein [Planctomycetaceae bacterium]
MAAAMLRDLFRPRAMDDFPGPFALRAHEVAEELRRDWERTCRDAAENRRLEELHATREDYHALLKGHLRLLEDYLALTEIHQRAFGANPVRIAEMTRAVDELRLLYEELFPRWQTSRDLAQILIEKFALPADRLQALAATHAPPPSWLEETDDPFSTE